MCSYVNDHIHLIPHISYTHSINAHGTWCYSIKYNVPCTVEGHRAAAHTHSVLYTVTPLHYALYIAMLPMVVYVWVCMAGGLLICISYVKPWSYAAPVD